MVPIAPCEAKGECGQPDCSSARDAWKSTSDGCVAALPPLFKSYYLMKVLPIDLKALSDVYVVVVIVVVVIVVKPSWLSRNSY